jgi:chromosome partitioning protein
MRVIVMAAQKGGTGKTSIASSLAAAAAQAGERVALVDLDPQGSLREWHDRRSTDDVTFVRVDAAGLGDALQRLRAQRQMTLMVIDTPGALGPDVSVALREADLVLLPVRPSLPDVTATRRTAEQIKVTKGRFAFILSQVQTNASARAQEAAEVLSEIGPLFPGYIALRTDHQDAVVVGQGVTEYAPRGRAAEEIRDLWDWIQQNAEDRL